MGSKRQRCGGRHQGFQVVFEAVAGFDRNQSLGHLGIGIVLLGEAPDPLDCRRKFGGQPSLRDIAGCSSLKRFDREFLTAFGGHEDDRDVTVTVDHFFEKFQTINARHLDICDDHTDSPFVEDRQRLLAILGFENFELGALFEQIHGQHPIDR